MKSIIVLFATLAYVCANAIGGQPEYLADTPEVAAAKAAHFAEKAKAAYAAGSTPDYITTYYNNYYKNYAVPAAITVLPNGYLADTPEVAAAKSAFQAEYAKAALPQFYNSFSTIPASINSYSSIPASVTVLPNGYLADTPEVASAKAAHLAELAKAAYAAGAIPSAYIPGAFNVLPNGYLADTPEVAAAKASFFAEFAKASSPAGLNPYYSPYYTWNGYAWVANQ